MGTFFELPGLYITFFYLPDYAQSIGFDKDQGALLISVTGATSAVSRILCGFISDKPWADPLKIHNILVIVGGIATMGVGWMNSYPLLITYASIFGLSFGKFM